MNIADHDRPRRVKNHNQTIENLNQQLVVGHVPWFASSNLIDLAPNLLQFRFVAERHETTATTVGTLGAD